VSLQIVLNKNHGAKAPRFSMREKTELRRRFTECFDALGAQRLLNQTTLLHDRNFLKIRFERAVGGTLGERAVVTKGGCLAAVIAFSHRDTSFPYNNSNKSPFPKARHFTIESSLAQEKTKLPRST
jgi:hypothetical protein